MKKAIWKYVFPKVTNEQSIFMPKKAQILTVQAQNNEICIWALVDLTCLDLEPRTFMIVGTGDNVYKTNLDYIGTVQIFEGFLAFHIFEMKESN